MTALLVFINQKLELERVDLANRVTVEVPSVLVMVVTAVVVPSAIGVVTVVLPSALVFVVDVDVVVLASALVIVDVTVEDPSGLVMVVTVGNN